MAGWTIGLLVSLFCTYKLVVFDKFELERFSSRLNRKGIPIGRDF